MISIGARAHDFGRFPADELASRIASTGVQCVQLALSKALPNSPRYPQDVDINLVTEAFNKKRLDIAVLGCYINPVHPDPHVRDQELERFEQHLLHASGFHCGIVGTETGSCNPDCSFHPNTATEETFQLLLSSVRRLVKTAERISETTDKVFVGIEPVAETHTIHTPQLMQRLIEEINSPYLGVIFDPTNLVGRTGIISQNRFLDDCFKSFGEHIIAIHAKDYRITEGSCGPVKSKSLPAGTGDLDWSGIFRRLKNIGKTTVPVILEDLRPEDVPATLDRMLNLWNKTSL